MLCAGMVARERLVTELERRLRSAPLGGLGLYSLRGMGKTTLARALCNSVQHAFPGRTCLVLFPSLEQQKEDKRANPDLAACKRELLQQALRHLGVRLDSQQVSCCVCIQGSTLAGV